LFFLRHTHSHNHAEGALAGFDHAPHPFGGAVALERDVAQVQNFFFYYTTHDIAIFGITEPESDNAYNAVNAAFVTAKLVGKSPQAIVVFGHALLSSTVQAVLPNNVPILYVTGNLHTFCSEQITDFPTHPNSLSVRVAAGRVAPLLFFIVKDDTSGAYSFHHRSTAHGCSS
jgi:hypothetical protein